MAEQELQDQIIIKRRSFSEPETPKGGVWKIAFADFMTAMMCFFLVMWLINAANEETRQAVAAYFNPMRLAELNRKGLKDPEVAVPMPERTEGERTTEITQPPEREPERSRDALFSDPYRVLSEIAGDKAGGIADAGSAGTAQGGSAFRDPFEPEFRTAAQPSEVRPAGAQEDASSAKKAEALAGDAESAPPAETAATIEAAALLAGPESAEPPDTVAAAEAGESAQAKAEAEEAETRSDTEIGPADLRDVIAHAVEAEAASQSGPSVAVVQTGEGVLISMTDDADFGMFAIGSAEPQPAMVRIMERIAEALKTQDGTIVIRGHTDARPFRTDSYDNWRLSTDRAQMAYYMLVRGGLEETRVEAIEGYAERRLKVPADPEAAENRRIEILVRQASL